MACGTEYIMKKVYTSPNLMMVGHVRNILESSGIPCVVRNQFLSVAMGEIPPIECWPELWVVDDDAFEQARGIVEDSIKSAETAKESWICPACGEEMEGQFTDCWNCGTSRPVR